MPHPEPLQPSQFYHIYNRGIDGQPLFREQRNYPCFLELYAKYIEPIAETYAYCLLSNHFHLLLRIKDAETGPVLQPSRQFNNLFIAYAKAFNKAYGRTGGLFESPFKRSLVDHDGYFAYLVVYIHRNPRKHGFVDDFRLWPCSSYQAILSSQPTRIQRATVLDWFDGRPGFEEAHDTLVDGSPIEPLVRLDQS